MVDFSQPLKNLKPTHGSGIVQKQSASMGPFYGPLTQGLHNAGRCGSALTHRTARPFEVGEIPVPTTVIFPEGCRQNVSVPFFSSSASTLLFPPFLPYLEEFLVGFLGTKKSWATFCPQARLSQHMYNVIPGLSASGRDRHRSLWKA